jgi:hypothetical protein
MLKAVQEQVDAANQVQYSTKYITQYATYNVSAARNFRNTAQRMQTSQRTTHQLLCAARFPRQRRVLSCWHRCSAPYRHSWYRFSPSLPSPSCTRRSRRMTYAAHHISRRSESSSAPGARPPAHNRLLCTSR